MKFEFNNKSTHAFFGFTDDLKTNQHHLYKTGGLAQILWNRGNEETQFHIDDRLVCLKPGQIATITFFHHLAFEKSSLPLTSFLFNREFYCLSDHDQEVSCNGILFYGTQEVPVITIPAEQYIKFNLLHQVFIDELNTPDKIQGDMLQMLLKRLIIICTRLAKEQLILKKINHSQIEIIRRFNFLVDIHFRTKRQVSDYADMLNKSPKTLANLFLIYDQKTPHQIIHERVALEAKRLLRFSDKQTKEIAFDLGFDEPANFSKFFKKIVGQNPSEYRNRKTP
jgi:AraC family 4-hydroxyphenylacetate 3-monooxygenase operon regulatory protein